MSGRVISSDSYCTKCGMSWGGGVGVTISGMKCWRSDCPGAKPPPPKLKAVK